MAWCTGCDDAHDMCPDNSVCDGTHNCNMEGATLIKKIHLTTATCAQCNPVANQEGGAKVYIDGVRHACTTRGLDRPSTVDYGDKQTADFVSKQDADIMGQCNNVRTLILLSTLIRFFGKFCFSLRPKLVQAARKTPPSSGWGPVPGRPRRWCLR